MDPAPFLRGNAFPADKRVPYPRWLPGDGRLPADSTYMGSFPVGVRLELAGDAEEIEITYQCKHEHAVWPSEARAVWETGSGRRFEAWNADTCMGSFQAAVGEGSARVPFAPVIYLPERLAPEILSIEPIGGSIEPTPKQPRWICYGDSIAEGFITSSPALAWPAIVQRAHELDVFNMSYAGAARGELCSAEQIAGLDADVISLTHGTNCWNRVAHSAGLMKEATLAFVRQVRIGHPNTPIVVCTPVLRPEAEDTRNALGATLQDLRDAMSEAVSQDPLVTLIDGRDVIDETMLFDHVHPNDDGHRAIAAALGPILEKVIG